MQVYTEPKERLINVQYWIDEPRDGFLNMAIDEAIADAVASGEQPIVRIYGWESAFLTLGYFQTAAERLVDERIANLPFTRRLSGGGAIVHHHEITYCLAIPDSTGSKSAASEVYCSVHQAISKVLATVGCNAMSASSCTNVQWQTEKLSAQSKSPFLCFDRRSSADLVVGQFKIVGSAQRRVGGALLQHGSILMEKSPFAAHLLGVKDLVHNLRKENPNSGRSLPLDLALQISSSLQTTIRGLPTVQQISSSTSDAMIAGAKPFLNRFFSEDWRIRT